MRLIFANCVNAIVAVNAISGNVHVVKVSWQPGDSRVAIITGIAAGDMGCVLAGRGNAIMTGCA